MRRTESNVRVIPGIHTRDRAALRFREGETKNATAIGRRSDAGVHKLLVLRDLRRATHRSQRNADPERCCRYDYERALLTD
jgi:hypothetical protein